MHGFTKVEMTDHQFAAFLRKLGAIDKYTVDPAGFNKWCDNECNTVAVATYDNAASTRNIYIPELPKELPVNFWSVAAAFMAMSNMGLQKPDVEHFEGFFRKDANQRAATSIIYAMAGIYMESEEIEDSFVEETRSWVILLEDYDVTRAYITWPDAFRTILSAIPKE